MTEPVKFFNLTCDASRVPQLVEAQDGFLCLAGDYKELEQDRDKWKQIALNLGHTLAYEADME